MSDAAPSDLPQRVLGLARAMVAASRNRALYPPDHPAVGASLTRLRGALADAANDRPLALGVTPTALVPDDSEAIDHGPAAEAAALLHARDILRLVFAPALAAPAVREFVEVIASDPVSLREHPKQDLSGYPEKIGSRTLNLCTMVVSIVDVYDALRSNRIYRQGLPTDRIKAIMAQQDSTSCNCLLLRRFMNLVGPYPVGTVVRLATDQLGVVVYEHPGDPFRPQVKVVRAPDGSVIEEPFLLNTWEGDAGAVVEAVDPDVAGFDPLSYCQQAEEGE